MRKKQKAFFSFSVFFTLSLLLFFLSKAGLLEFATPFLEGITVPMQKSVYAVFLTLPNFGESTKVQKLQEENKILLKKVIELQQLKSDNSALKDQFQTQYPQSSVLLPSHVIGAPGFLPNQVPLEVITIDKGNKDHVKVGQAVIFQDNIVGKIDKVSFAFSRVLLVVNPQSLIAVESFQSHAFGVIRGRGKNEMLLDNVLLSEQLNVSDIIVSKGDIDTEGKGFPRNLVVGRVTSIEKKPSALFQTARVKSNLDMSKLSLVFVITQLEK